jgi:hypothetical protein
MKYIIDLTLVLQTLALVAGNQELSRKAIKLAVKPYHDSPMSGDVHNWVQEYDRQLTFLERTDRDSLDQLVKLLQSYKISAEEMTVLRGSLPAVDLLSDELRARSKSPRTRLLVFLRVLTCPHSKQICVHKR